MIAMSEIWREKGERNIDSITVNHLSNEQFIIHTLLHCAKDLSSRGFFEIKGFIDLLYAIRAWEIDWSKVVDIAQRWGVEKDILPGIATLNHHWQADIPIKIDVKPIDLQTLIWGIKDRQKQYYANLPSSYLERLLKLRKLPDETSQVRYLLHLFFPTQENLRWRYNLSGKSLIKPYYFLHLLLTFKKTFLGFWHKLLYHPEGSSITH